MKMKLLLLSAVCSIAAGLCAKEPWRDPRVFEVNRLPARAIAVPCDSAELALAIASGEKERADSPWIESLNGAWRFEWKHTVDAPAWEKTTEVSVPGCWQLQGTFDPPLYVNITYPIAGFRTGDVMEEPPKDFTSHYYRNPVGRYTRAFTVPATWKGRRTTIHFGGVSSAFELKVNGRWIGYSEDSRLPAEFDLTDVLRDGTNEIEVTVYKHCDGTFLEEQDFWRLSGIFRDVWLVSEQKGAPRDLVVGVTLSDDFARGALVVRDETGRVLLEKAYDNPRLWSCEAPNLYRETLAFTDPVSGQTDHRAVTFGFRRVEIKDSVLLINGKRALVKGVNRHEMEPATGYTVTRAEMERDIAIFKRLNINAVRTCHYPNDPTWYELCDRAGIYVVCEANIEAHGSDGKDTLARNPLYHDAHVARNTNMVKTFRNHPSIVFWSLGNEAGDGKNFADAYAAVKALDPSRPVQYERAQDTDHSDVKCPMYARAKDVEKYVRNNPAKPYILCEYAHAMGNSTGDIQAYWDVVHRYPSAQGGFIWDFADQALWKTDARGTFLAYGGDFGDKPNDDNFNCNGIVTATRELHPGAWEVKHAYQPVRATGWDWATKRLTLKNDFRFTPLDGMRGRWKVEKDGKLVASGELDLRDFPADSEKTFPLDAPDGDALTVAVGRDGEDEPFAFDQFAKPFRPIARAAAEGEDAASLFRFNFARALTDNDRGMKLAEKSALWFEATETQKLPEGCVSSFGARRTADGTILVDWTLTVPETVKSVIPRVGVTFRIPSGFTDVTWHGRGPWENYSDRATGALLGVWEAKVGIGGGPNALNPDNYSEPGEQGYRTDCRWVRFASPATAKAVTVTALDAPFGFNAWPYSQAALEAAKHQRDLKDEGAITVNVDAVQMGVGGDDSWGAWPHRSRLPGPGTYRLRFAVDGL